MPQFPDPVWPVIVLAAVSFADGLACIKPMRFIAECFEDVNWPRRLWWIMPPIKFAVTAGLILGMWVPYLGLVIVVALVLYFGVAIGFHIRARDFGRNLFVNAVGMLVISMATIAISFVP